MEDRLKKLAVKAAEEMFETYRAFLLEKADVKESFNNMFDVTVNAYMISLYNGLKMISEATKDEATIAFTKIFMTKLDEILKDILYKFELEEDVLH